jgi:NAD(P)H-hydrate epimerase
MLGGPAFAALGALRSGCGLAILAMPAPLLAPGLVVAPSATGLALPVDQHGALSPSQVAELLDGHAGGFNCIAVGPGLGAGLASQQIVARLVARDQIPLVLDADALNALAALSDFPRDIAAPAVLTPHPGEYRRLADALGLHADPIDPSARSEAALVLAQRLGCVVVLKGAGTVVSDGLEVDVNQTGNAALATAGSGDVLTGVIAGLVAQFYGSGGLTLLQCARLGVHLHGLAADSWAQGNGHAGMLASDLLTQIPLALHQMRGDGA